MSEDAIMGAFQYALILTLICGYSPIAYSQACDSLDSLSWLLGDWRADNGKITTTESWRVVGSTLYEGIGEARSSSTAELRSSESLKIMEMDRQLFYLAKPSQANLPVAFKLTECSNNSAIFENREHDFPKKLEYQFNGKRAMQAIATGEPGQGFTINFIKQRE